MLHYVIIIMSKGTKENKIMTEKILYGYQNEKEIKGYYGVKFFDEDGRDLNHWLGQSQIRYFLNRKDAVKYIKEVKSWNAIGFTQALVYKIF